MEKILKEINAQLAELNNNVKQLKEDILDKINEGYHQSYYYQIVPDGEGGFKVEVFNKLRQHQFGVGDIASFPTYAAALAAVKNLPLRSL
ncbi:MAG: hypothetical protein Nk1A_8880 [Endomicrobiia bacterium]|nr:MAG: hypothetical protein Nk1A_8880 [Endomicrobiia bacterium]